MQADDLEEALGKEAAAFSSGEMTFNEKDVSSPEMKEEPVVEDSKYVHFIQIIGTDHIDVLRLYHIRLNNFV